MMTVKQVDAALQDFKRHSDVVVLCDWRDSAGEYRTKAFEIISIDDDADPRTGRTQVIFACSEIIEEENSDAGE